MTATTSNPSSNLTPGQAQEDSSRYNMKLTKLKLTVMVTLAVCAGGYFSGFYFGHKNGIQQGKETGRRQEIAHIKENLWKSSLDITSKSLDDSELVIVRQFTYPADSPTKNVVLQENKDVAGLTVKRLYASGTQGMGGAFWDSIWQLKNQTNAPINIGNSFFENLPPDYDINQRFQQDPITVNPSEQDTPSNR